MSSCQLPGTALTRAAHGQCLPQTLHQNTGKHEINCKTLAVPPLPMPTVDDDDDDYYIEIYLFHSTTGTHESSEPKIEQTAESSKWDSMKFSFLSFFRVRKCSICPYIVGVHRIWQLMRSKVNKLKKIRPSYNIFFLYFFSFVSSRSSPSTSRRSVLCKPLRLSVNLLNFVWIIDVCLWRRGFVEMWKWRHLKWKRCVRCYRAYAIQWAACSLAMRAALRSSANMNVLGRPWQSVQLHVCVHCSVGMGEFTRPKSTTVRRNGQKTDLLGCHSSSTI